MKKDKTIEQQIFDILHKYFAISINQPLKEIMQIIKQKEALVNQSNASTLKPTDEN